MTSEYQRQIRTRLFPPHRAFSQPYRGELGDRGLELRTFASSMGQMTESVVLGIMSEKFQLNVNMEEEVKELFLAVKNPLLAQVKKIPVPKITYKDPQNSERTISRSGTFGHKLLYPAYFDMLDNEEWSEKFKILVVATDSMFSTKLGEKFNSIGEDDALSGENRNEHSEFRYLVDAVLMIWGFYFDKDTRNILSHIGKFVPDVDLGTTQVDGLFISPLFNLEELKSNGRNGGDILQKMSRGPNGVVKNPPSTVPALVDCSIFEMKSVFLARDVASHPQRKTPRSWHVAQCVGSMYNILNEHEIGLAPEHFVILNLGSLQTNAVYIINTDSLYWQGLADKTEQAIYALGNSEDEQKLLDGLGKFLDLTTLLAREAEITETNVTNLNAGRKTENEAKRVGKQKKLRSFVSENWGSPAPKEPKTKKTKKKKDKSVGETLF